MISCAQLSYVMHIVILVKHLDADIYCISTLLTQSLTLSYNVILCMYCMFPLLLLLECQDYNYMIGRELQLNLLLH